MAGTLLRVGDSPNELIREYCVDTIAEVVDLPTTTKKGTGSFANQPEMNTYAPLGSTCIVGNSEGDTLVYMLFSFGWKMM